MQGRWEGDVRGTRPLLAGEALEELAPQAQRHGVPLLFEPLNRYETNVLNNVGDSLAFLKRLRTQNVMLLCDLFHMNIEEAASPTAQLYRCATRSCTFCRRQSPRDSFGHTDLAPLVQALHDINYTGYLSAEILPLPDSDTAAEQTIVSFRKWFPRP